jgi:methyltransferase (TIGR00027 family)
VPVDLAEDWGRRLLAAGLDTQARVAWLAEGLLAYLSPKASDSLVVTAARLSLPGSRMGLSLASAERLRAWREAHPDGAGEPSDYQALWRSAAPAEAAAWLGAHGWEAEISEVQERAAAYGRPHEPGAGPAQAARLVDAIRR